MMGTSERDTFAQLSLPPGFRFFPTDEELMVQYLCRQVAGHRFSLPIIAEIDLYKFDPWVLPSKAVFGEKEWYFFSPRDRKYPNGSRPNRVAGTGYWKATGTDKVITTQGRRVGIKKALVFYVGKAPKGTKTNWIMHEYRLSQSPTRSGGSKLDDWVLCRIYKKSTGAGKSAGGGAASEEQSAGGSSSSSSHLDDVLESLTEMDGPMDMMDQKPGLQNFGSGSFDWSVLAGLTSGPQGGDNGLGQAQFQMPQMGGDVYAPSLPALRHVDSPLEKYGRRMEEEVQSGIRTQCVNSSGNLYGPGALLGQRFSDPGDPFGARFSAAMTGFEFRG